MSTGIILAIFPFGQALILDRSGKKFTVHYSDFSGEFFKLKKLTEINFELRDSKIINWSKK